MGVVVDRSDEPWRTFEMPNNQRRERRLLENQRRNMLEAGLACSADDGIVCLPCLQCADFASLPILCPIQLAGALKYSLSGMQQRAR